MPEEENAEPAAETTPAEDDVVVEDETPPAPVAPAVETGPDGTPVSEPSSEEPPAETPLAAPAENPTEPPPSEDTPVSSAGESSDVPSAAPDPALPPITPPSAEEPPADPPPPAPPPEPPVDDPRAVNRPSHEEPEEETGVLSAAESLKKLSELVLPEMKDRSMKLVKDAIGLSRDYLKGLLTVTPMAKEQKRMIAGIYAKAEQFALAGKGPQADAMLNRVNNYLSTTALVKESKNLKATNNYLKSLLGMVSGAASGFLSWFGTPLISTVTEIGKGAMEDLKKAIEG